MPQHHLLKMAARIISSGGVVAYPTEGVFGLGCLPDAADAVERILRIKQRSPAQGLILIAADFPQLEPWVDCDGLPATDPDRAITWIVPASDTVPPWVTGQHSGVAVRISTHPVAAALCRACDSALISTSANLSGRPPVANRFLLQRQFRELVDFIVPGDCGPASGPSEIRDLESGAVLRAAS